MATVALERASAGEERPTAEPASGRPLLRTQVRYHGRIADLSYGRIPRERLIRTLASGRLCSILLEDEIAAVFGIESGTQGAAPDLVDPRLGAIQMKTYHATGDTVIAHGPRKGVRKGSTASIWTTKSGFWDRRNRLTAEQLEEAERYIESYDHFLYVDISRMAELEYSFVVVPSAQVAELKDGFFISEDAILSRVVAEETLPD